MDFARLYLDVNRNAAYLTLSAVANNALSERVRAGRRANAGFPACGKLEVCTSGVAYGQIYTDNLPSGILALSVKPNSVADKFAGVWAGCEMGELSNVRGRRPEFGPPAWGVVKIRALDSGRLHARNVIELTTDDAGLRGSIRINDADDPAKRAILEIDDQGPILYLTDGIRSIAITPSGVSQNPDKAARPEVIDDEILRGRAVTSTAETWEPSSSRSLLTIPRIPISRFTTTSWRGRRSASTSAVQRRSRRDAPRSPCQNTFTTSWPSRA
jgi:hypothetical protein